MAFDAKDPYPWRRAAIESIAGKIDCTAETLSNWVRRCERDSGVRVRARRATPSGGGQAVLVEETDRRWLAELDAELDGFSLHAAMRIGAHERKRLERLCRYITRPALSDERIRVDAAGQVQLELKTPWRDGTTHLVWSPLEFMQRTWARDRARERGRNRPP